MNSEPDQDFEIDPEAAAIVERDGEEAVNKLSIEAALYADRLSAAGDTEGAARWRRIAEGVEEMLDAAGVPLQKGH